MSQHRVKRDDILNFLYSERVEKSADYIRRGREHARLSNETLIEKWRQAFIAMADDPFARNLRRAEDDLQTELDLRQMPVPFEQVNEAKEKFSAAVDRYIEQMRDNGPEAYRQLDADLKHDINVSNEKRGKN